MRKLVVATFLSVDGVMQAPGVPDEDTDHGFVHGGWQVPYVDDELGALLAEQLPRISALLLGRRTYQIYAAAWPRVTADNPVAATLNDVPKYVVSRTLDTLEWHNSSLLSGDVAAAVAKLKSTSGGEIHVQGSGELVQTLMRHGLVDEYRLLIFPVLLGAGKRLFREGMAPAGLRLVSASTTLAGVAIHTYHPAGPLAYGAFTVDAGQMVRQPAGGPLG
jgi:dihydrofolate reductase